MFVRVQLLPDLHRLCLHALRRLAAKAHRLLLYLLKVLQLVLQKLVLRDGWMRLVIFREELSGRSARAEVALGVGLQRLVQHRAIHSEAAGLRVQRSLTLADGIAHEPNDLPHHWLRQALLLDRAEVSDLQHVQRERVVRLPELGIYLFLDAARAHVDILVQIVHFEVSHDDVALLALHGIEVLLLIHDLRNRRLEPRAAPPCFQELEVLVPEQINEDLLRLLLGFLQLIAVLRDQSMIDQFDEFLVRQFTPSFPADVLQVLCLILALPELDFSGPHDQQSQLLRCRHELYFEQLLLVEDDLVLSLERQVHLLDLDGRDRLNHGLQFSILELQRVALVEVLLCVGVPAVEHPCGQHRASIDRTKVTIHSLELSVATR